LYGDIDNFKPPSADAPERAFGLVSPELAFGLDRAELGHASQGGQGSNPSIVQENRPDLAAPRQNAAGNA